VDESSAQLTSTREGAIQVTPCHWGRRQARPAEAELIYYERPDVVGPKESQYAIHRTPDPMGLRAMLSAALGVRGVVRKHRSLYRIGVTRLHLDRVEGLGEFVELEVVLQPGQETAYGVAIAHDLMEKLGVPQSGLLHQAYINLLESKPSQAEVGPDH